MNRLHFITCGSVDDGKSTLIGRILFETRKIHQDELKTLEAESKIIGTQNGKLDLALLVDGLQSEREQGITIDIAYRYFSTNRRSFIVADSPGHEQYTRNMATAASRADVAIILVDARKGVLTQTQRHSRIAQLMGIKSVALAINKMDLVNWSEKIYLDISELYLKFASSIGIEDVTSIPISALEGDNIVNHGKQMRWYQGPTLLNWLETVRPRDRGNNLHFAMPVQWVNRPNSEFRGYSGRIASGQIKVGDNIRVSPSGRECRIQRIIVGKEDEPVAETGQSITLVLDDEVDISRGDVIASNSNFIIFADQFQADLIWMHDHQAIKGRPYVLQIHTKSAFVNISAIKYKIDINSGIHVATDTLTLNEIGRVNMYIDRPISFVSYNENSILGSFIIIDRITNETIGAGMVRHVLRRAENIQVQSFDVSQIDRAALKMQKPVCLWFTGLSGSGKSTIANMLEKFLIAEGKHTYILDGDNIRHGLNRDLGFTEADRVENIRRVGEVAKLLVDAGLIVIVSLISPFKEDRAMARRLFKEGEFIEIFVDAPLNICEKRDVKGLYAKARQGKIKNFTGIDSSYEEPDNPDIRLATDEISVSNAVEIIVAFLKR